MAHMNTKFQYMYDAAPSVSLWAADAAAKTASFTDAGAITLDVLEGYWNTQGELADKTLAVIVNINAVNASARTATMTFASVVATDTFTLSDGVDSATFIADTDFDVGADDTETAAAAAEAINDAYDAGDIAISATSNLGVITLTNHLGTGGTITEAETTITTTAFAGNNETYSIDVQGGPVGFGSTAVIGTIRGITKPGQYVALIDIATAKAIKSDLAAIRLSATLAGVAPSIDGYSWIAGIQP